MQAKAAEFLFTHNTKAQPMTDTPTKPRKPYNATPSRITTVTRYGWWYAAWQKFVRENEGRPGWRVQEAVEK